MLQLPLGYRHLIQLEGYAGFYCSPISRYLPVRLLLLELIKAHYMVWLDKAFTQEKFNFPESKTSV